MSAYSGPNRRKSAKDRRNTREDRRNDDRLSEEELPRRNADDLDRRQPKKSS